MTWPVTGLKESSADHPDVKWDDIPAGIGTVVVEQEDLGQAFAATTVRVSHKDSVMGGLHVVTDTRIPVYLLYDLFVSLRSVDAVQAEYPHLSSDDVFAAIRFALSNPELMEQDRDDHSIALDPSQES
jgi:uncharacterized protein (DUF433 family)